MLAMSRYLAVVFLVSFLLAFATIDQSLSVESYGIICRIMMTQNIACDCLLFAKINHYLLEALWHGSPPRHGTKLPEFIYLLLQR